MISVIVPIYNVEQYLEQCLDSIISQTYSQLEIILVDDGSTDSSGQICDKYARKDERIVVIHKTNGGLSDARNAGISVATGEYISFIDSDDYIATDMYNKMIKICEQNHCDIVVCARDNFDEDGNHKVMFQAKKQTIYTSEEAIEEILLNRNMDSAAWDKLYHKKLFTEIRYPVGVLHEDLTVTSRVFSAANKIVQIPDVFYQYRIRKGSITKQGFKPKKMDLMFQSIELKMYIENNYPNLLKQANKFV